MAKFLRLIIVLLPVFACSVFNSSANTNNTQSNITKNEFLSGTYKSDDQSYLKIYFESSSLILAQAINDYAPDCSLVVPLNFNMVAPNIYLWSKDSCQMTITTLTKSDKLVLTVNKLDKCFDQYDIDQPFSCFGRPMMENQGVYIIGKMYKRDNLNDQI